MQPTPQVAKAWPHAAIAATLAGMELLLNGKNCHTRDAATVQDLLQEQGLAERRVAVEVNGEIVPRGRHASHLLRPGDRVEIVHALGGG